MVVAVGPDSQIGLTEPDSGAGGEGSGEPENPDEAGAATGPSDSISWSNHRGCRLRLTTSAGVGYDPDRHLWLGHLDGRPHFASLEAGDGLSSLRQALTTLGPAAVQLAIRAAALAQYHASHRFCPNCGAATAPHDLGRSRLCPRCGSQHFPRTDPAVIVAVTDPAGRLLLGHHSGWPEQLRSLFAGFSEAGESLEQTVRREVAEEVGVTVDQIRYFGSQPWPMPRSLMVGFTAQAAPDASPRPDGAEITAAQWYTRDELNRAVADQRVVLPPPVSIAHRLITAWRDQD